MVLKKRWVGLQMHMCLCVHRKLVMCSAVTFSNFQMKPRTIINEEALKILSPFFIVMFRIIYLTMSSWYTGISYISIKKHQLNKLQVTYVNLDMPPGFLYN